MRIFICGAALLLAASPNNETPTTRSDSPNQHSPEPPSTEPAEESERQIEKTVNDLLQSIRAEIPKGWTASYNKEYSWLKISRDEPVLSRSPLPNGPPSEKPEQRQFAFAFRVIPEVSPAEHRRLSAENDKIQKEVTALYKDMIKTGMGHKFDDFEPRTISEEKLVARYNALKKSLHYLPEFYFHNISLRDEMGVRSVPELNVRDDRIRDECKRVQENVLKLLSRYEDA